jgi:Na+/H+-translocating membrane pyrophosphatase
MLKISEIIFTTCKTYLIQQGRFLLMLFAIIGSAMTYYFMGLQGKGVGTAALVLFFSVVGMAGSYAVAWYGIRVNTWANSRTAFASLRGEPWDVVKGARVHGGHELLGLAGYFFGVGIEEEAGQRQRDSRRKHAVSKLGAVSRTSIQRRSAEPHTCRVSLSALEQCYK